MTELYQNLSREQADICGLVLTSSGIFYRTKKRKSGWMVWVNNKDFARALSSISLYFEENPELQFNVQTPADKHRKTFTGIWMAIILMVFYVAIGEDNQAFIKIYGSSADHILKGEVYRTATSLMLHVDAVHLVGNMAAIALFGSVVCSVMGIGTGWLMILLTGMTGNYANACLYQTHHLAVGASTAIFGAIGIIATHQFWRKMALPGEKMKAWLPLAGGLGLLAMLGSGGGRVDLMAHLFGFGAGLTIETLYTLLIKRVLPVAYQAGCFAVAAGILLISWLWPVLMTHG
ncbi:MAG: rhomboid family intramembrane serine protease [Deltaproteobacteria bacterium]|nr:rhomboid family intramembrane serine protease [Deltaproteobacteria bacterium]